MFAKGIGVVQDYVEAVRWYRLAATQGHADAQTNLGFMYGNGRGVPMDVVRAHMWFNLAAAKGDADAVKNRDFAASKMSPQQMAEAQKLARECRERNFNGCGSSLFHVTDLKNLTDSVMNGWRADYQKQMSTILQTSGCSSSVDLRNLTDSVMNGWRADFEKQTIALLSCSGCQSQVNLKNLTDSVMNKWRADYERQMTSLISCVKK